MRNLDQGLDIGQTEKVEMSSLAGILIFGDIGDGHLLKQVE